VEPRQPRDCLLAVQYRWHGKIHIDLQPWPAEKRNRRRHSISKHRTVSTDTNISLPTDRNTKLRRARKRGKRPQQAGGLDEDRKRSTQQLHSKDGLDGCRPPPASTHEPFAEPE